MHELSIADAILRSVRAELPKRTKGQPTKVGVRVGQVAGVDVETLAFSFEALVLGTDLQDLNLEVESVPYQRRCNECRMVFHAQEYQTACTRCGDLQTEFVGGDELEIAFLEVDEA